VKIDGKYGFIDKTGKVAIQPKYDTAGSFRDGLAGITIGNEEGYIDKEGKIIWKSPPYAPWQYGKPDDKDK
jgi:hypothetical protein